MPLPDRLPDKSDRERSSHLTSMETFTEGAGEERVFYCKIGTIRSQVSRRRYYEDLENPQHVGEIRDIREEEDLRLMRQVVPSTIYETGRGSSQEGKRPGTVQRRSPPRLRISIAAQSDRSQRAPEKKGHSARKKEKPPKRRARGTEAYEHVSAKVRSVPRQRGEAGLDSVLISCEKAEERPQGEKGGGGLLKS